MASLLEQSYQVILADAVPQMYEGVERTPHRAARAWRELTSGYNVDVDALLTTFDSDGFDQIVVVKDIPLYSLCEHHLLPFVGKASVAYLPSGRIIGLSKIARIVEAFSRRLQVQERLTQQIGSTLAFSPLNPHGVAVIVEAEHLCMTMRGVQKPGSRTVTSWVEGTFRDDEKARAEVLGLLA